MILTLSLTLALAATLLRKVHRSPLPAQLSTIAIIWLVTSAFARGISDQVMLSLACIMIFDLMHKSDVFLFGNEDVKGEGAANSNIIERGMVIISYPSQRTDLHEIHVLPAAQQTTSMDTMTLIAERGTGSEVQVSVAANGSSARPKEGEKAVEEAIESSGSADIGHEDAKSASENLALQRSKVYLAKTGKLSC